MRFLKTLLEVVALVSMISCGTSMQQISRLKSSVKLEQNRNIYVARIDDGAFNGKVYNGSGAMVARYFEIHLQPYAAQIVPEEDKADYAVKAVITHWEPRRAEWSGVPTQVKIQVSVIDVSSGKELIDKELIIKGRSVTMTPQSAEGLAEYIIRQFCQDSF
jgi:hypothetical protein